MSAEPVLATADAIRSALRDLVQSEGWKLFEAQISQEWGPSGYGRRMQEALAQVPNGPDRAFEIAAVAERVDATARAVEAIRRWPYEEIAKREPVKPKGPFAALRRGPAR